MRFSIGSQSDSPENLMRQVGYLAWVDPRTSKRSFIKKVSRAFYPRFHIHMFRDTKNNIYVDLHFDARKPLHKIVARSSENNSPVVLQEADRIKNILAK